jgi:hypothetical protein
MKTRIIRKIGVLATLLCLALLGCDMGNTSDAKPTEAKGAVRVIVSADAEGAAQAASRTVVPANPGFTYTLSFSAAGRTPVTAPLDGSAGEVTLTTGDWTLSITGKKNGETVAESDPVDVTVSEEGTTVSVIVHPTLNGAKGTFSYAVSADAALSEVSAVLMPLNVGNAEQSAITLDIESAVEQSVAAGYYRLTVRALKGVQPLVRRETVHIYSSTETYKSYTLTAGDFAAVIYLGGVLSGGIAGYTPVAVAAYEDAAGRVPIDESAVGEGWRLAVEDTLDTVYFKVRLEKDGETYYSKLVTVSDIPASGRLDIDLAIEGYTVTFDASGGAFENGDTVMTLTALENETLTLPTASQSGRAFAGWYSTDKRFTTETRISGDTALYAKWAIGAADIAAYLANAEGGESSANPVPLVLSMDLANGGWESLRATINTGGKYVSLDLAACAMDGTEFVPGVGAGANRVAALVLPDAAKSVPAGSSDYATFRAFTALTSLSGAGVETTGSYAFYNCTSLTSVSLPAATDIRSYAFYNTSLTEVSLPVATDIGSYAFYNTSLTAVSLPTAQTIGYGAFSGCTSLASVSLPATTYIGDNAFSGCTSLTSVSLPAAETTGDSAFSGCTSLTSVSLPMATSIGGSAFQGCTHLTAVDLPVAMTVGGSAFSGCTSLATVSLPAAMTIGNGAFYGCMSLIAVSLPAAMTIGTSVFYDCRSLTSVSLPATPPSLSNNSAYGTNNRIFTYTGSSGTIIVRVPTGAVSVYTSTWGVSADTSANGNTGTYGSSHKAVLITDAAPLTGLDGLANADNPVSLALSGSLTNGSWAVTLAVIAGAGKYVSLDLSACTMDGTQFAPGTYGGAYRVTALVLPNVAQSVQAGTSSSTTFRAFTALGSLSGASVETIGYYAFSGTSLVMVSLPAATDIGASAFNGCTSLASVSLPTAIDIGTQAFYGCTNLTTVSLPAAQTIGASAFDRCTSLESVSLPAAETIGASAFYACAGLATVSLPVATSIGREAFYGTSLVSVSLPVATSVGYLAFSHCMSLAEVNLPVAPPVIAPYTSAYGLFYYTGYSSSGTITVRVPAGAVSAYTSAWGVSASTAANGNASIYGTYHKAVLITDAAPLTGLDGLDGLANAPGGATADNPVSLSLSGSFTNDRWALTLAAIAEAGKYVSLDLSACTMDGTQFAPGTYAGANRVTALVLPDTAKSIPAGTYDNPTFRAFTALASLSGAGVETIGAYAFYGHGFLTTVDLPAATDIGVQAFYNTSLTSVSLPAATTIGNYAFYNTNLTSVSLPAATNIGYAFRECTSLESVSLPAATSIYERAFDGCTSLTTVSLPVAQTIGEQAFYGCTSLTAVDLPVATSIGSYAFYNTSLREVSLPAATNIGYAFRECTSLTTVSLPAATSIGNYAFDGCTSLTTVSLPVATYIYGYAFQGCTSLTTVSLPAATSIYERAFDGCTSLATVNLPVAPPSIGSSIFYSTDGSSGTITVRVPAGAVSAYTSAWGVSASTAANGNTSKYGNEHKAVIITDAAQ